MNRHFNGARDLLLERSGVVTNWQFLSISFDPDFDKPGVLNRYAQSYRGKSPDRWLFAAASTNVMASMSRILTCALRERAAVLCTTFGQSCLTLNDVFTGNSMATNGRRKRWLGPV